MEPRKINKDLILREKLALQRTILANQSTFLSFLRSSMYFLVAGVTVSKLVEQDWVIIIEIVLISVSILLIVLGTINYINNKKKIVRSEMHIGDYKNEYESKKAVF